MGLAQSIPRYNVPRANSRSLYIIENSNGAQGLWKIRFFKDYSNTTPRFILTLGAEDNTKAIFQIINPNGTVESTTDLGAFSLDSSQTYYLDICNDVMTLTAATFDSSSAVVASSVVASSIVASASASAEASASTSASSVSSSTTPPLITVTNVDFPNIVSIDATNDGNANVLGEIVNVTAVPGCVSSSLNPDVSPNPFSNTDVQITIGILAAFVLIFLIMTIVFGVLWAQLGGGSAAPPPPTQSTIV